VSLNSEQRPSKHAVTRANKESSIALDCVEIRLAALFYQQSYVAIGCLKEKEYIGIRNRKLYIALCRELA
jgi:hypothetical protein